MKAMLEELFAKPDHPVDGVSTDLVVDGGTKMSLDHSTCNAVARILERLIPPIRMALDRQSPKITMSKEATKWQL